MDANGDYGCHPPKPGGTDPIRLQIEVEDVAATLERACQRGAKIDNEPDEFTGVPHAQFTGPFC